MILEKKMFHTQEKRLKPIAVPILCKKDDAWLGDAYYFWYDEADAVFWGNRFKRNTGKYQIYSADIISDNILNTVFNEDEYLLWIRIIEKAAKSFVKNTNEKTTLKQINTYRFEATRRRGF